MRESSLHQFPASNLASGPGPSAKSLFQNILAVNPYSSRFCPDLPIPSGRKPLAISILQIGAKKNEEISPKPSPALVRLAMIQANLDAQFTDVSRNVYLWPPFSLQPVICAV